MENTEKSNNAFAPLETRREHGRLVTPGLELQCDEIVELIAMASRISIEKYEPIIRLGFDGYAVNEIKIEFEKSTGDYRLETEVRYAILRGNTEHTFLRDSSAATIYSSMSRKHIYNVSGEYITVAEKLLLSFVDKSNSIQVPVAEFAGFSDVNPANPDIPVLTAKITSIAVSSNAVTEEDE